MYMTNLKEFEKGVDKFCQMVILDELRKYPNGRTEKQLVKAVNKKTKILKSIFKAIDKLQEDESSFKCKFIIDEKQGE